MNSIFNPGYYNEEELAGFGFKSIGTNVKIAKNCTIIGLSNISIGSNIRIDGNTTIIVPATGWLEIGSYIHIGGYCFLSAGNGITLKDFSGLSQGVRIYSRSDDYSGMYLCNPTVPEKFTNITGGAVTLNKHVVIGSGTVIMPKVTIGEGSAVGAQSLVTLSLNPWGVFFGCPVKRIKDRSRQLLELEEELVKERDFPSQ